MEAGRIASERQGSRGGSRRWPRRWAAWLTGASLLLAACGQAAGTASGTGPAAGQPAGTAAAATKTAGAKPILIGLTGPLSGSSAQYGQEAEKAVQLVIHAWNAKGGVLGRPIKLVAEDDQGSPKQGAIVANKLVSEGVAAVIAPDFSGACAAAMPVYERNHIPMVTSICSASSLSAPGYKYFFRTVPTDALAGRYAGDYLVKTLKYQKVAVLDDRSTYGEGFANIVAQQVKAGGGTVVLRDHIQAGQKDYTATLTRVKAANPQAVFYGGYYPEFALLVKQSAQIGLKAVWLGSSMERPDTIRIAGPAALGALSAGYPSPEDLTSSATFVSRYKSTYGKDPGPMTNLSYDAAGVLLQAIKTAGTTAEPQLRDALAKTTLHGASGTIRFNGKGNRTTPFFEVFKVEKQAGKLAWVPLKVGAGY